MLIHMLTLALSLALPLEDSLQSVSNPKMGFSIDMPAHAQVRHCDEAKCTFAATARSGEITVEVAALPQMVSSLEKAVQMAAAGGGKKVARQEKQKGGQFLVITRAEEVVEIWYFVPGRKQPLQGVCRGVADQQKALLKICKSLRGF